ncbi:MAG: cation-transporting P-type ATPase [Candidatus Dormiibacterota bacterium]
MKVDDAAVEKPGLAPAAAAAAAPEEVLRIVKCGPQGLSTEEARARLARIGPNAVGVESRSLRVIVLEQVKNGINLLLAGAGVLTIVTGDFVDGAIILGLITLNVSLSIIQEYRAEKALEALRALLPIQCTVVRDGKDVTALASELVPGDLVYIRTGDLIPADLRILEADSLDINQATLTGESVPQTKTPDPVTGTSAIEWTDIAFAGTVTVGGEGKGVVIATGRDTQFGETASLVKGSRAAGDFQLNLTHFGAFLLRFGLLLAAAVFISNALLGRGILVSLTLALALALGVVPEALPAVTATTLALGARDLARKKVLVRRLASVEDISVVDTLCIDKTGTITENRTRVVEMWSKAAEQALLEAAVLCTSYPRTGVNVIDDAVIEAAAKLDLASLAQLPRRNVMRFSADTKRMCVAVDRPDGTYLICKGAASVVVDRCSRVQTDEVERPMDQAERNVVDAEVGRLQSAGGRVLAVAIKTLTQGTGATGDKDIDADLALLGLLSLSDPPRAGAADALDQAGKLGIEVKIVTGDARPRATALARQIGMDVSDDQIIAASELSGPDVADVARRGRIFAGVVPADKYHLVQVLQHLGRHVAVTGDGVNDAPALQTADVGIALASGTDATKGAADLVLLDDNLEVIVEGIQQGRRTFTNINRYLLYTMVSNFANVIIVSIASFFLNFLPLLPSQVLLLNVLADLPMLAVVTDNVALEDLATPRRWDVRRIVELSIYLGIVNALFAFGLLRVLGGRSPQEVQTAWFLFLGSTALLILFAVRTRGWLWSRPWPSLPVLVALGAAFVVTVALPNLPATRSLLHFGTLSWAEQAGIEAYSLGYLAVASALRVTYSRLLPLAPTARILNARLLAAGPKA